MKEEKKQMFGVDPELFSLVLKYVQTGPHGEVDNMVQAMRRCQIITVTITEKNVTSIDTASEK